MKNEFEFQYYYRRWLGALPILIISIILNLLLSLLSLSNIIHYILCIIVMLVLMCIYYKISENCKIFHGKGYYWTDNDIVYIQAGKKLYKISEVKELLGDVKSIYSSKYAVLLIETNTNNVKLFSIPIDKEQKFEDTSVYPIYKLVLDKENDLKPVKILNQDVDYWFRKEE